MSSVQSLSFSKEFTSSLSLAGVSFTDRELGRGSDAVVVEANHQGTLCAAKKLHQILLDDQSSGGAQRLVDNFENEITTWHSLRHPHIVLLLGVHFEHGSRVPALILEKMQTSLRKYIEMHNKEDVPLPDKVFILRQVSQALAYLHSCQPPLVHHDLSPNNILLNQDSLLTKVTDFGMSRAVYPSHSTRKSSVKGTLAFMSPEALASPPKYTEKLDIFSFGNITLFTVTHLWPEPGPHTVFEGDKPVAVLELQRREQYTKSLTAEEHSSFFPMMQSCLDNRPDRRPTSLQLLQQMRQIEEAHSRPAHSKQSNTVAQLTQQLKEKDNQLKRKDDQLQQMQEEMRTLLQENQRLQHELGVPQRQVDRVTVPSPSSSNQPPRNWKELKYQKTLECGGPCYSIAVQGDVVYVGGLGRVLLFSKITSALVSQQFRSDQIKGEVFGYSAAFIEEDTIVVSADRRLRTYTTKGELVRNFHSGKAGFNPRGLTVGPDRCIFVCDISKHCICVFNFDGKLLSSFGSKGSGVGHFNCPSDVCMGGEGLLFISDVVNSRICVHSVDGEFVREFPTPVKPYRIAATHCNHLVVSRDPSVSSWPWSPRKVMIMTTGGQLVHEFGKWGSGPGQFRDPEGVAVDNEDCVYVCDRDNNRVQVYNSC